MLLYEVKGAHAVLRASEDKCTFGRGEEHPGEVGCLRPVNTGGFKQFREVRDPDLEDLLAAARAVSDSPLTVTPAVAQPAANSLLVSTPRHRLMNPVTMPATSEPRSARSGTRASVAMYSMAAPTISSFPPGKW